MTPLRVVIAGGGVAALEGALALRDVAGDCVAVTLIAPQEDFHFRPLAVGVPFAVAHPGRLSLASFARDVGAELVRDALKAVEPGRREVVLQSDERLACHALLMAVGARSVPSPLGGLQFTDENDPEGFGGLLRDVEEGYLRRVAFVVPPGSGWPLPLYELALMTARQARSMGVDDAELTLITPEAAPLSLFGPRASSAVADELDVAGVSFITGQAAEADRDHPGGLVLRPGGRRLAPQRIVTLPALEGIRIDGLPAHGRGFLPVDGQMRVVGVDGVWAAGDGIDFPIKQGGLATQQADVAALGIAAEAGLPVTVEAFEPVLRGTLLTGDKPWHLRWAAGDGDGLAVQRPLWWPPTKIAGRFLGPYLAGGLRPRPGCRWRCASRRADRPRPVAGALDELSGGAGPRSRWTALTSVRTAAVAGSPQRRRGTVPMTRPSGAHTVGRTTSGNEGTSHVRDDRGRVRRDGGGRGRPGTGPDSRRSRRPHHRRLPVLV